MLASFGEEATYFEQVTKEMGTAFKTLVKSGSGSSMAVAFTALL